MAATVRRTAGQVQAIAQNALNQVSPYVDRYIPAERRSDIYNSVQTFLNENPRLATFVFAQIAISGPVIALFLTLTLTVALFSLLGALLLGLLGTVLFTVGAIGFALVVVLPTLFFTTMLGLFFWFWGMGAYSIFNFASRKGDVNFRVNASLGQGKIEEEKSVEDVKALDYPSDSEVAGDHQESHLMRMDTPDDAADGADNGVEQVVSRDSIADYLGETASTDANGTTHRSAGMRNRIAPASDGFLGPAGRMGKKPPVIRESM